MTTTELIHLVIFRMDAQRYALPLATVERIVRAVEVTPLPNAPSIVLGAIDVEGRVLPVLNVRRRFGLPERAVCPADQFLIAQTTRRTVVLAVDETEGMIECAESAVVGGTEIVSGIEQLQGVVKLDSGLVLIHDLDRFLSLPEARALDEAMGPAPAVVHG